MEDRKAISALIEDIYDGHPFVLVRARVHGHQGA